jgi:hypothetical protein
MRTCDEGKLAISQHEGELRMLCAKGGHLFLGGTRNAKRVLNLIARVCREFLAGSHPERLCIYVKAKCTRWFEKKLNDKNRPLIRLAILFRCSDERNHHQGHNDNPDRDHDRAEPIRLLVPAQTFDLAKMKEEPPQHVFHRHLPKSSNAFM